MKNDEHVNEQPTDCDITEDYFFKYKKKDLEDYVKNNDKHENEVLTDNDTTQQLKNDKKTYITGYDRSHRYTETRTVEDNGV